MAKKKKATKKRAPRPTLSNGCRCKLCLGYCEFMEKETEAAEGGEDFLRKPEEIHLAVEVLGSGDFTQAETALSLWWLCGDDDPNAPYFKPGTKALGLDCDVLNTAYARLAKDRGVCREIELGLAYWKQGDDWMGFLNKHDGDVEKAMKDWGSTLVTIGEALQKIASKIDPEWKASGGGGAHSALLYGPPELRKLVRDIGLLRS